MKIVSTNIPVESALQDMVHSVFTHNGVVGLPDDDKHLVQLEFSDLFHMKEAASQIEDKDLRDTVTSFDLTRFIPTTVSRIVREAIEPELLIVPNLFQEIRYEGASRQVEIGALGAFHAAEVAEGQEYEEVEFNFADGHMVQLGVSKHGLKMRVTDEVIDDNLFDVFGLWMRLAGRALARHKEEYGIKMVNEFGRDVFDNTTPSTSENGVCTGRDITGAQNGSMTADDIFELYVYLFLRGFNPDTLIMSPLAWKVFMTDAETREIVLKGATLATNRVPGGSYAQAYGTGFQGLGYRTTATGRGLNTATGGDDNRVAGNNPFVTSLNPLGASFNIAPEYLPTPLRVIVSPHVSYKSATVGGSSKFVTDVVMADSSRCGILLTREGPSIDQWDDPERDIKAMKVKERWGMGLFEQGKGVAVARDVVIDRNYVFDNVNQQTLSALDTSSALVT